jgi:hypothetical protein
VLDNDIAPTDFTRERGVEGRALRVLAVRERRDDDIAFQTGFSLAASRLVTRRVVEFGRRSAHILSFDRAAVDSEIAEIRQQFLGAV